jgi:hypothetical protein
MFADIAGFTALTEAHGDLEAAQLVDDFCDSVRTEMAGGSGAFVKTIGDALMQKPPVTREFLSSGRPGSNRRHPAWKAGALPTELHPRRD